MYVTDNNDYTRQTEL